MAANSIIPGKVININTTGFVTSDTVVITGWYQGQYSTSGAGHRALIVDFVNKKKVLGLKTGANQLAIGVFPLNLVAQGLSASVMSNGASVMVYLG